MDEKGFLMGVLKKTKCVVNINLLKKGKLKGAGQDGNRGWITFVASICCDGTYLPAGIIFKGHGGLQNTWVNNFDANNEIAYFASTPTGWTNEDIAFKWLTVTFDRATRHKASNGNRWRLLWVDGHNSHINMRFLDWCNDNRVFVAMYPSHSTHRLQPLDVSCFSPLAIRYSQHLDQWIAKHGGIIPLNQSDFYGLFKVSLIEAFTESNILSGWRKTGLYPFDASVVLQQLERSHLRPQSSQSDSQQSLQEQPDWRKMRRVLAKAKNENPLNRVILKGFEAVSAQNVLLKAEIEGLKETVVLQKQRAVRSRNLFEKLIDEDGNKAIWFSPTKIKQAHELLREKEVQEEQERQNKEQQALQRQRTREEKELQLQIRRTEREQARLEREQQKILKQAATEAAKKQREVNKQLKLEARNVARDKKGKTNQLEVSNSAAQVATGSKKGEDVEVSQTRSGRKTKRPQRFQE